MKNKELKEYDSSPDKECEGRCDRKIIRTDNGPVIVCNSCKRVVMDNRIKRFKDI